MARSAARQVCQSDYQFVSNWPTIADYSRLLQDQRQALLDERLTRATIEKDERGNARLICGTDAVVCRATLPEGRDVALRLLTKPSDGRCQHYETIAGYLRRHELPSCLVPFEYVREGIRDTTGKPRPLVLMDWVHGETLFDWVRSRCDRHRDGDAELESLAEAWLELTKELADARIAHGDLDHTNVLVTPAGKLKLVDYDCLCVPGLAGMPNPETGSEPYQHPQRNADTRLSLSLDNFASLVIYAALRALAADPELWHRYVEPSDQRTLLFRHSDFQSPESSPLLKDLRSGNDPHGSLMQALIHEVISCYQGDLADVPTLSDVLAITSIRKSFEEGNYRDFVTTWDAHTSVLVARKDLADLHSVVLQWRQAIQEIDQLERGLDDPRVTFRQLDSLWQNIQRQGAHPELDARRKMFEQHVQRREAWERVARLLANPARDEAYDRELEAAWDDRLFAGWRLAERGREQLQQSRQRLEVLQHLHALSNRAESQPVPDFKHKILQVAQTLPDGYRFRERERVEQAVRRCEAIEDLLQAIRRGDTREVVSAWNSVKQFAALGEGMEQWLRHELLRSGALSPPSASAGLRPAGPRRVTVGWEWPRTRFANECVVSVCRAKSEESARAGQGRIVSRHRVSRRKFDAHGRRVTLAASPGCFVLVTALIDLGFETFESKPLVLGVGVKQAGQTLGFPTETARPQTGRRWFRPDDTDERADDAPAATITGAGGGPRLDENVQFTVSRPQTIQPQKYYTVLAFAHLSKKPPDAGDDVPDPVQEVVRQTETLLGPRAKSYRHSTEDTKHAVPRGDYITFLPSIEGVEFDPPSQTVRWNDILRRTEFQMCASVELDGRRAIGQMSVLLGSTLLAEITLNIEVNSAYQAAEELPPVETSARPYRKIFASYSRRDFAIVDHFDRCVSVLGDEYLVDVKKLRSGEVWSAGLERLIREADVFQLFWSSSSMRSPFVRREWEYAISLRRENFVRPFFWETPRPEDPPELPPPDLDRLEFQRLPPEALRRARRDRPLLKRVLQGVLAATSRWTSRRKTVGNPKCLTPPAPRDAAQDQPAAAAPDTSRRRTTHLTFPMLGPPGSGKTSWMAMFNHTVMRGAYPEDLPVARIRTEAVARIDAITDSILHERTPPPSDERPPADRQSLDEFSFSLDVLARRSWLRRARSARAEFVDLPGGHELADTAELVELYRQADGVLYFLDPTQEAKSQAAALTQWCADLRTLYRVKPGRSLPVPLAVCVSKLDMLVSHLSPERHQAVNKFYRDLQELTCPRGDISQEVIEARSELVASLLEKIIWPDWHIQRLLADQFGRRLKFFPISNVGFHEPGIADLRQRTLDPFGIFEPCLWLLRENAVR